MKLWILVGYKFLIKKFKFWGQSGYVIPQKVEFIRLAISQPFTKKQSQMQISLKQG